MSEKKIALRQIDDYASCSNYSKFNLGSSELVSGEFKTFKRLLMDVYRDMQNLQTLPTWNTIRGRVSREVISDLGELTPAKLDWAYQHTRVLLTQVQKWYSETVGFPGETLINLDMEARLDRTNVTICGSCDCLLLWQDQVILIDIQEKAQLSVHQHFQLWHSMRIQGLVWLLSKQGIQVTDIHRIVYKPDDIEFVKIKVEKPLQQKIEQNLKLISAGISNGIYFPSVSESCQKCPYRSQCDW